MKFAPSPDATEADQSEKKEGSMVSYNVGVERVLNLDNAIELLSYTLSFIDVFRHLFDLALGVKQSMVFLLICLWNVPNQFLKTKQRAGEMSSINIS